MRWVRCVLLNTHRSERFIGLGLRYLRSIILLVVLVVSFGTGEGRDCDDSYGPTSLSYFPPQLASSSLSPTLLHPSPRLSHPRVFPAPMRAVVTVFTSQVSTYNWTDNVILPFYSVVQLRILHELLMLTGHMRLGLYFWYIFANSLLGWSCCD